MRDPSRNPAIRSCRAESGGRQQAASSRRPVLPQRAQAGAVVAQFGATPALNLTFRGQHGVNSYLRGLRGLFTGSPPTKHNSLI